MAIIKVRLEAVRYLAAKAKYENDETCNKIMKLVTYKRRGAGFINLVEAPFYKDGNSPRALNIISDMLDSYIGTYWYKLVVSDEGIEYIANVLQGRPKNNDLESLTGYNLTDEDILNFLSTKEMLLANKDN